LFTMSSTGVWNSLRRRLKCHLFSAHPRHSTPLELCSATGNCRNCSGAEFLIPNFVV
jgi:hypothetical protein